MSNAVIEPFKIGMIAPRGVGKTSLITAIFHAIQKQISKETLNITFSDTKTKEAMNNCLSQFKTIVEQKDDLFTIPEFLPTTDVSEFSYSIVVPIQNRDPFEIKFSIMDYPGDMLETPDFYKEIAPHINDSVALLVPISADILMHWQKNKARKDASSTKQTCAALQALEVDNVVQQIDKWLNKKVENKTPAQLFFVPVKCEYYFDDNGGRNDYHDLLNKTVKECYFDRLSITPEIKALIDFNIFSVDTYGIAELQAVDAVEENNNVRLRSRFRRRIVTDKELHTKNAYELLIHILKFQIDNFGAELDNQLKMLESDMSRRDNSIEELNSKMKALDRQINDRQNKLTFIQRLIYIIWRDKVKEQMLRDKERHGRRIDAERDELELLHKDEEFTKEERDAVDKALSILTSKLNDDSNRQVKL